MTGTEVRCWRCDKKLAESRLEPGQGEVVIVCGRCGAKNVVHALDNAVKTV